MVMTAGTMYATTPIAPSTSAETTAILSRLRRHHARRYGPAERGRLGSLFRSATTADTTGARWMSGRSDLGVDEPIGDVHDQIREHIAQCGEEDDPLHERIILRLDRV